MKNLIFTILFCLTIGFEIKAQGNCEVDSFYDKFDREVGFKIIQSKIDEKCFYALSISDVNTPVQPAYPKFIITKLNSCGEVLWRKKYDSVNCAGFGLTCGGVVDIWEEKNGNLLFSGYLNGSIMLYKTDSNGNLIWKNRINGSKYYTINSSVKLNENKYLFIGNILYKNSVGPDQKISIALISDTLGNILIQDSFNSNRLKPGDLLNAYVKSDSTILMLGYEENNLMIINLTQQGNRISTNIISQVVFNTYYPYLGLSYDNSEVLYINSPYIARFNLSGILIKDSLFTSHYLDVSFQTVITCPSVSSRVTALKNKNTIISSSNNIILDSNFKILWFDNTSNFSRQIYNSLKTSDSLIVCVGTGKFKTIGLGNETSEFWFGIKSVFRYVKTITIQGSNTISQKQGSIQLTATVLPDDAVNKNVKWSVNDSNKASITQTGLLTAKADGTVIVTVESTDSSKVQGTKSITITNQTVGFFEKNNIEQLISLYPNPASNYIEIKAIGLNVKNINLYDITGMQIKNLDVVTENSNQLKINTIFYPTGFYLMQIETDKGTLYKKLVLEK